MWWLSRMSQNPCFVSLCAVSKFSLRNQRFMNPTFTGRLGLPRPSLIFFWSIANMIQHIDHIFANCWEKLPTVKRAADSKIKIGKSGIRVSSDERLLISRDRIPAKSIIIHLATTFENLWQTRANGFYTFILKLLRHYILALIWWNGNFVACPGFDHVSKRCWKGEFQHARVIRWYNLSC